GPPGPAGPAGPAGVSGKQGAQGRTGAQGPGTTVLHGALATSTPIPADGSSVNIAGLSLPVGTWMIRARLDASLPSTASGMRTSQVTCQIGTGALSEAMAARLATPALAPSASSDDSAMLVGWMPATFTAPGRAIVSCRQTQATGNGAAAAAVVPGNIRITATRADSLQTLPITP
ncbi:MAG: hypothetical protein KDC33_08820, partial [Thermoleophilia bacterium]|nr:hypothetical protein [Thermoleophilia bacterium]